jgi:hypothetical protein
VGTSKQATVTVTNSTPSGGDTLTVTRIVVSGTGFSLVAPGSSFSLAPGQSITVSLNFAPAAAGNAVGQVSLYLAGNSESRKIRLAGTTIAGNLLTISPSPMSFGAVTLGMSKSLPVTLAAANSAVTISSASWSGQGYSISGIAFPITIPANRSIIANCNFAPQEAGTVSGQVIFFSDAANSTATATFSGAGASSVTSTSKVNLIWDPSGPGTTGYNVYRGTSSGGPYARLNAVPGAGVTYTDFTAAAGTTYYYVATSIAAGVESARSNEVVTTVPAP